MFNKGVLERIFVYLILLPGGSFLSWYGIYKLVMWILK